MSAGSTTRVRALVATACIVGGAALFIASLLWPMVRLAIPGPLYHLEQAVALAAVALVIGIVGCALSGEFAKRAKALAGLSIGGVLLIAGSGAPVGQVVANPTNLVSRGSAISVVMAAAGYALVKLLGRDKQEPKNVT